MNVPETILVVGSTNVDLIATTERLPGPGETVLGKSFMQAGGGKGANQAVAAARSGGHVIMLGAVGGDAYGDSCLTTFADEGIDTSFVFRAPETPTGVALITVDDNGENCIVVAPGANEALTADRVGQALDAIGGVAVCVCQLETPLDGVREALRRAHDAGAVTILNPAPARDLDDALLATVTCITPNESETEILTGLHPNDPDSAAEAGKRLIDRGVSTAIITLGEQGVVLIDADGSTHVPAPRVSVVDTTAAGDTFTGCLAASVAGGLSFRSALPYACTAASLAVTRPGAQPSIPQAAEVSAFRSRIDTT